MSLTIRCHQLNHNKSTCCKYKINKDHLDNLYKQNNVIAVNIDGKTVLAKFYECKAFPHWAYTSRFKVYVNI